MGDPGGSKPTRVLSLAAAFVLLTSAALAGLAPSAAALSASGVWIFPTSHRTDAVADDLDDTFYTGANNDLWLQDSFFGDSTADEADVSVDFYNPTSAAASNVQVFAAINDISLLTDISFTGGESGDVSYAAGDIGGGTPFLPGGASIDDHDVYPAYFVSYGVGDLGNGSSNILSITVVVNGDFEGGLIVHLDYSAEDAAGGAVSGPFEADMNIFEAGDFEEPPACNPGGLKLSGTINGSYSPSSGVDFDARLNLVAPFEYDRGEVRATLSNGTFTTSTHGNRTGSAWSMALNGTTDLNLSINLTGHAGPLVLDGDVMSLSLSLSWEDCASGGNQTLSLSWTVDTEPTGDVHSASWWEEQLEKTEKGKKKAKFNASQADDLLQAVALHSDVFTYGPWNGTAPTGEDDEGWLDIAALDDAIDILEGKSPDAKKVRKAEREALALWLNVASNGITRDTALEIKEKADEDEDEDEGESEEQTGQKALSSSYDEVSEILAFAEGQISDWQDGSGASKADLKLARKLAKAVNNERLVAA